MTNFVFDNVKAAPYLTEDSIQRVICDQVREAYPSGFRLPFDVEEFAEIKLGLPIEFVDLPSGVLGWMSIQENKICIDTQLERHVERFRFTVAHEIGHFSLHRDFIQTDGKFLSTEETSHFYTKNEKRLEYQANLYASKILVPDQYLTRICNKVEKLIRHGNEMQFIQTCTWLVEKIAQDCNVSLSCARICAKSFFKNEPFLTF